VAKSKAFLKHGKQVLAACVTLGRCTLSVFPVGTIQASAASSENLPLNPVPQELSISGKGFPPFGRAKSQRMVLALLL
jgi:hyaluronoglucosaminidase